MPPRAHTTIAPVARAKRVLLEDPSAPPASVAHLLRRMAWLAGRHWRIAVAPLAATVLVQLLTLAGKVAEGLGIDVLAEAYKPDAPPAHWPFGLEPPAGWPLWNTVLGIAATIVALALAGAVARYLMRVLQERFAQACVTDLRSQLYDKLQSLSFAFFDDHDTGQIINRISGDALRVRVFIEGVLIRAVVALASFAIFVVWMLSANPWLTAAVVLVLPLQAAIVLRYGRRTKPRFRHHAELVDRLIHRFQESIAGVRVVRVFGREPEQLAVLDRANTTARDYRIDLAKEQAANLPLIQAVNIAARAVVLGVGGLFVLRGEMPVGDLWVFLALLGQLVAQVDALTQIVAQAPEALAGAERVFRLLDAPPQIANRSDAALPDRGLTGAVTFDHVTFGYREDRPVLHDIAFDVRPGETIAIVGPTGAGKTTLLNLIARFYDPDRGAVRFDGLDIRDLPLKDIRRTVGFVFQEPFLFSNTVRNNVRFGAPDAHDHELAEALRIASANEFIDELADGLDTVVGERGVSLSGGQRQRLTLARALVLKPPILMLDDATGAVDPITEADIQRALDDHVKHSTTFIVAHRLSTLRRADRILVLDQGRIVDFGTHDELMNKPGHYRAAALIQLELDRAEHNNPEHTP